MTITYSYVFNSNAFLITFISQWFEFQISFYEELKIRQLCANFHNKLLFIYVTKPPLL